ncbi:MAG: AraC family transcriptional regulator [Cyanobacteria bacterium P01_H01_bin.119]
MSRSIEFAQLWTPQFAGLELFQAHLWRYAFDKHFHDAYTIGLNETGLGQSLFRGNLIDNPPSSFNLLNPGEVHTGQAADDRGWGFRNFYISLPLMTSLLAQLEQTDQSLPVFGAPVVHNLRLRSLFWQAFQALHQAQSLLTQQSLLLAFLSQLLQHHSVTAPLKPAGQESQAVARVREYLEAHYAENISIATLSQLSNLSSYYLIRSFHRQWGLPPHRYQQQIRLLKAKQALQTSQSLAEIAIATGFFDQSHFTRSFKRVFGVTPGQYRQRSSVQDR